MAKKNIVNEVLTDPKHWMGWVISTGAVIGILSFLSIDGLLWNWFKLFALLLTIVSVDVIKHITRLQ